MRRRTIGLALTLTASVSVAGAPAEAVTRPDPVAALKRQPYGWYPDPPDYMPAGKSWILNTRKNDLSLECGQIRLSDPATLRHVLSTTKVKRPAGVYDGTRTTLYEGSTTIGNLYKLNPRLWVGLFEPDSPWNVKVRRVVTADVRFSGWGDAVEIEPPPAEEVATQDELVFPDFD